MSLEPYLFDPYMGCYKEPNVPKIDPDPTCTVEKYKNSFRERWNLIKPKPFEKFNFPTLTDACSSLEGSLANCNDLYNNPGAWANGQSLFSNNFKFPEDNCCRPECPRPPSPPQPWFPPRPPMNRTTTSTFYHPHQIQPCWQPPPGPPGPPAVNDPCQQKPSEGPPSSQPNSGSNYNFWRSQSACRTSDWASMGCIPKNYGQNYDVSSAVKKNQQ